MLLSNFFKQSGVLDKTFVSPGKEMVEFDNEIWSLPPVVFGLPSTQPASGFLLPAL